MRYAKIYEIVRSQIFWYFICLTHIYHTRCIMTQCVLAILKEHSFPYKMISKAFYKLISSLRNMRYRWCSRGVKILTERVNFDLSYLKTGWSEWTHILHIILLWYLLSIEIWNIKIGDPSIQTMFCGYSKSLLIEDPTLAKQSRRISAIARQNSIQCPVSQRARKYAEQNEQKEIVYGTILLLF